MNNRGDSTFASPARDHSAVVLVGIVVALAVVNSLLQALSALELNEFVVAICLGILVVQPLSFGVWTALGPGSIFTRVPIALPGLMLLFVVPGHVPEAFADLQRRDFIATALMGFAIFAVATALFLVFRRVSGFRLQSPADQPATIRGLKFSTKYLLALMTAYAVAFGMTLQLQFQAGPPPASILGPDFFISIVIELGAVFAILLLPTLAVPLLILYGYPSRRTVRWLVVLWLAIVWAAATFLMGLNASDDEAIKMLICLFLAQCAAALPLSIAAICLRFAGVRLVRYG